MLRQNILSQVRKFRWILLLALVLSLLYYGADLITTKYGKDSIDGMKYLQKIVQLPYTIPLWNPPRLSDTITNMMKKTHLPNNVIDKVLEPKMQELIIKATELNPSNQEVHQFNSDIP